MLDNTSDAAASDPIRVRAITVRTGRIICDIEIANRHLRSSTPELAAFLAERFPDLPHHACVNGVGDTFGCVMGATSVPHLLEHVAISLQVRADELSDTAFIGTTEWLDEQAGTARIQIGFRDDLAALRAFNEAVKIINNAVLICNA